MKSLLILISTATLMFGQGLTLRDPGFVASLGSAASVPTDGLICYLDSADFAGGGTWEDRVNLHDASATDVSSSGGFAVFNGSSSFLDLGRITEVEGDVAFTLISISKLTDAGATRALFTYDQNNTLAGDTTDSYWLWSNSASRVVYNSGPAEVQLNNLNYAAGNWIMASVVKTVGNIKVYEGTTVRNDYSSTGVSAAAGHALRFGHGENVSWWQGNIGIILIYNRAITTDELSSIYSSYQSRFSL